MSKINWARIAKEAKSQYKDNHYNVFFKTESGMSIDQGFTRIADAKQFVKEHISSESGYSELKSLRVSYGTLGFGGSNEDVTNWFLESYMSNAVKKQKETVKLILKIKG